MTGTQHISVVSVALVAVGVMWGGSAQARPPAPHPEGVSACDWADIRGVYGAGRHAARSVAQGAYQMRNPSQQWRTHLDGCGFLTVPDGGGWEWGLQLERYGRAGDERAVAAPLFAHAQGNRVNYEWSDGLTEWYINDDRGLEHGFTLHARPESAKMARKSHELRLTLAVVGNLYAQVSASGCDVRFVDALGNIVVNYSGLTVFDADGALVRAQFECLEPDRLVLVVHDECARYPLTIDPLAQQAYLKASNTGGSDFFGTSVAVSGDTVVVGAHLEDSSATGVNGDQADNGTPESGAVYIFVRDGASWTQQAYLKASNTGAGDQFGNSVSISGDTLVVAAFGEDSNATGVNGNQADNSASGSGAAYVFVRNAGVWTQQAYLKASNTGADDGFAHSVSVSGDTIVVGASGEDSNATGVNGNQANNSALSSGAAYIFVRMGDTWTQQAYLKASNTGFSDFFGDAVSVSGDTVVVGASLEDSNSTGVNGNQANNSSGDSGAAYVFARSNDVWTQQAYLKASNTGSGDHFGERISVSGDTVVVGAFGEDSNATGVDGDQANNSSADSGAAYVFVRSGNSWTQQAYLKASNTGAVDLFGISVAVSENTVVVGARREDSSATGVNGDQANNDAIDSGAAYVFMRKADTWAQQAYLKSSNSGAGDYFGYFVSVSGETFAVGAPYEASSATGVNGNQSDNSMGFSGAAYVFRIAPPCRSDLNDDSVVDGADLGILLSAWSKGLTETNADLNSDGVVDGVDLGVLLNDWGRCPA